MLTYDFIVIGAGILGLTIVHQLIKQFPASSILIIEKEIELGCHGSGRNSGVLHSGIYYPQGSLKAKFCAEGAKLMADYCQEHNLAIQYIGKVIVPMKTEDDAQLDMLYNRAKMNNAKVSLIDKQQLKKIEPYANSASGRALHSPFTAIVDPKKVLKNLKGQLEKSGVNFVFGDPVIKINAKNSFLHTQINRYQYGHLFNATGQFADVIAHQCGLGLDYRLLPFRGSYYALSSKSKLIFNGLIYPIPDLKMPFLGIHTVKTTNGKIYFGPSALPALGRTNYKGLGGIKVNEAAKISYRLFQQYIKNQQNFRYHCHTELLKIIKTNFVRQAKLLVPALQSCDLVQSEKVGIRAQLLNKKTKKMEMDFVVERKYNTTHILNAISPAFTCAFSFSKYIVEKV